MKVSKYTFLFDIENKEFYTYNTLSNSLIELDEPSYSYLNRTKKNKSDITATELDSELYEVLETKKFITENEQDDILLYKSTIMAQRFSTSSMHMTIAPTMNCCFSCHYCFEQYKQEGVMSERVMDSIVKYLNSLESKPDISLTWFGGEPLMAMEQMEMLYNKIASDYKKPTESDIITSGFHIDEKAVELFKRIGIARIQVTLDGLKETHNKVKFTAGCDDAFTKVINNVESVLKNAPEITVIFRVNITKENAGEYVQLYRELTHRYKEYHNWCASLGIIMERGVFTLDTPKEKSILFTPNESAEFSLDLYRKHKIRTVSLQYPSTYFQECGIRNIMSISIDAEGYAYKCWELIGNKNYATGRLDNDGNMEIMNIVSHNRQLYGADPLEDPICSDCKYLPVCHGGCPMQRIENKFEGKKNCTCTFYKGHIADFMRIHLAMMKEDAAQKAEYMPTPN